VISNIEEREILGELREYYVLKIPHGDMKIMIPVDKCEEIGVRDVIDKDDIEDVLEILSGPSTPMPTNWNHRNRENMEKLKTGKISEVADVVRNLTRVESTKHLSTGEKKMLNNAKQILSSEFMLSMDITEDQAEEMIAKAI
jgi:CarD family transcriptional regulator